MIKISDIEQTPDGMMSAIIEGVRMSFNSCDQSDSFLFDDELTLGKKDAKLLATLARKSSSEAKFRRAMQVSMVIDAPLYWWKQFDTYKVGTVTLSTSTMHKIHDKEFTIDDFSHEKIESSLETTMLVHATTMQLNNLRQSYLKETDLEKKKKIWYQMIQLLPSSYNQKRRVFLNFETLHAIFFDRRNHKLDEWKEFCRFVMEHIRYSYLFTLTENRDSYYFVAMENDLFVEEK